MNFTLLKRDLRLALLRGTEGLTALFFFGVVAALFPLALGPEPEVLKQAAPCILWVPALLASLLSLEGIWHRDFEDGTFDLLLLSPIPYLHIVAAKIAAHWIVSGVVLTLACAVAARMLFVPVAALPVVLASLLLGTLYMSLLGSFGAVLTFGARRPGPLLALLILPLFVPMLVLGVMANAVSIADHSAGALADLPARAYLLLQLALTVAALALVPPAAAAFLKLHLRSS